MSDIPLQEEKTKQQSLKEISNELINYNFDNFNLLTDKQSLEQFLQIINSKLGILLKGINK